MAKGFPSVECDHKQPECGRTRQVSARYRYGGGPWKVRVTILCKCCQSVVGYPEEVGEPIEDVEKKEENDNGGC